MVEAGVMFLLWVLIGIPALVAFIFFLLTEHRALGSCAPENRKMEPGMVWLQLVPVFNVVWQFLVVLAIAESFQREFEKRGLAVEPHPSKGIGLAVCILNCTTLIPVVNWLTSIPAVICWIIYWVKIAGLKGQLAPQV